MGSTQPQRSPTLISLRIKLLEISILIDKEAPLLLGVTETCLHFEVIGADISLRNYTSYRYDRPHDRRW